MTPGLSTGGGAVVGGTEQAVNVTLAPQRPGRSQ
jgi:hypothetical protein